MQDQGVSKDTIYLGIDGGGTKCRAVLTTSVTAQGKFYMSPNAGPSALAGKGCHKNYFNVSWQNDAFNEAAGNWASENGVGKVFLMAPNYPAGKDMVRAYEGKEATIYYNPRVCSHAAQCGRAGQAIFSLKQKPWIQPDNGTRAQIEEIVAASNQQSLFYFGKERLVVAKFVSAS